MDAFTFLKKKNDHYHSKWLSLPQEHRSYFTTMLLFPYFCLTDGVLTKYFLSNGGVEVNPSMNFIINKFGVDGIFIIKLLGIFVVIAAVETIRRKGHFQVSKKLMTFATYTYLFVCLFILFQGALANLFFGWM